MKNYIYIIIILIGLISCDKDDSVAYQTPIEHITFSGGGQSLEIGQLTSINIDSIFINKDQGSNKIVDESNTDYAYEWYLGERSDIFAEKISDSLVCKFIPKPEHFIYDQLTFKLTHKENLAVHFYTVSVNFISEFGSGLIVAHTKNGTTTCFDEIFSPYTVMDWSGEEEKIRRDNFLEYQGLLSDFEYSRNFNSDPLNFSCILFDQNGSMATDGFIGYNDKNVFYRNPEEIKDLKIFTGLFFTGVVNNGQFYQLNSDKTLDPIVYMPDGNEYYFSAIFDSFGWKNNDDWISNAAAGYDENRNAFFRLTAAGINSYTGNPSKFNVNDMGEFDCLYIGSIQDEGHIAAVMKSEKDSKHYAYIFDNMVGEDQSIVSLENCENINNAELFCSLISQGILYYCYDDKIYAVDLYDGNAPQSYVALTLEGGDKFTAVKQWHDKTSMYVAGQIDNEGNPIALSSEYKMLEIHTYNESTNEGKLMLVPIRSLNDVNNGLETDPSFAKTFGGFGRILATDQAYF